MFSKALEDTVFTEFQTLVCVMAPSAVGLLSRVIIITVVALDFSSSVILMETFIKICLEL